MFYRRKSTYAVFQQSVRNFGPKYVRSEIKSVQKLNVRNKTSENFGKQCIQGVKGTCRTDAPLLLILKYT